MAGVYLRRLCFQPWKHPSGRVLTLPRDEQAWTIQRALQEGGYRTLFIASHHIDTHVVRFMTRDWDEFSFDREPTTAALRTPP